MDVYEIEELSFDRLVDYYQRKGRQESFISLANMRSGVMNVVTATNRQTKDARNRGVNVIKSVGRRVMGVNREKTSVKCQN